MKITINYYGVDLECEGVYTRGRPGCAYKRNGDPGDPPEDESFELYTVKVGGVEIGDMLDQMYVWHYSIQRQDRYDDVLTDIETRCLEAIAEIEPRGREDY